MKFKRTLAFLLCLVMLFALVPTAAFADDGGLEDNIFYMEESTITVHAGESIAIWNTDIFESSHLFLPDYFKYNKYSVRITVASGTAYDVIYPGITESRARALSFCTSDLSFGTANFIKTDKESKDGMLVWIYVRSGSADLYVKSWSMSDSASDSSLIACVEDGSPLTYFKLTEEETDVEFPENNSLKYYPLALLGTNGSQFRRSVDEAENEYEVFTFTRDDMTSDLYTRGRRTDRLSISHSYGALIGDEVYTGSTVQVPVDGEHNRLGALKLIGGSVICALPRIKERGDAEQIGWEKQFTAYTIEYIEIQLNNGETVTIKQEVTLKHHNSYKDIELYLDRYAEPSTVTLLTEAEGVKLENIEHVTASKTSDGEPQTVQAGDELCQDYYVGKPDQDVYDTSQDTCIVYTNCGGPYKISRNVDELIELSAPEHKGMIFDHWESTEPVAFGDVTSPTTTALLRTGSDQVVIRAMYHSIEYTIAASACVGGSIAADRSTATISDKVRVTVTPDPGYAVTSFGAYADGGEIALTPSATEAGVYTFRMPADNVTLTATFEEVRYAVATSAELGTLTADKVTATVGETVTLTAVPLSEHQHFGGLTVLCGGTAIETTKVNDTTFTFVMPAGDVAASANFVHNYYVYFVNWNGVTLQWGDLAAGATPEYTGETPVCEPNEMYSFTFAGWDKEIAPVYGDTVYTATYDLTPREYNVTFVGADGTALQSDTLVYGATPEYTGATPTKATDENYVYTFVGWDKEIAQVTGDTEYVATFSTVPVLHEGSNALTFAAYENKTMPFTPETSGYYRFRTTGDAIRPSCFFADGDGDEVETVAFSYFPLRDMHFELVAWLEAGETYSMTVSSYQTPGNIVLNVKSVDMYTVHFDTDTPHGTVCDPDEPTFMAYTGQIIEPYATPDSGYGLLEITVTDASGRRLMAEPDGSYIMPASDVTVSATFTEAHSVTCDMTEYLVSCGNNEAVFEDWTSGDLEQRAAVGAGVEYSFDWDAGYVIDEFEIRTESGEEVPFGYLYQYLNKLEVWFTMPDEDIVITAAVAPAFDLLFDPGEADGRSYKATAKSGVDITLPDCPFELPDAKTFAGWSVEAGDGGATLMAPGDKVTMTANATATAIYEDAAFGDVNCDGIISGKDATLILQYVANYDDDAGTSSVALIVSLADVNCDGAVTGKDATLIKQYVANYDEETCSSTVVLGPQS